MVLHSMPYGELKVGIEYCYHTAVKTNVSAQDPQIWGVVLLTVRAALNHSVTQSPNV